jgi:3-oxoacyl-[acyl-carrier protein] reductase
MTRTAIVTGGAGTIGQATAAALLQHGRRVVLVDRDPAALRSAVDLLGSQDVEPLALDIVEPSAGVLIHAAVEGRQWQPATILVNNAGVAPRPNGVTASVIDITRETWQSVLDVNLSAPLFLAQHFLPGMCAANWGRIINVSSAAARFKPINAGVAYVASKAAILGLTRSIASAFGPQGVTCNTVAPGLIPTGMSGEIPPDRKEQILAGTALRRTGHPEEVGGTIAFLASDAAGYITGACVDVNGGSGMV